MLIGWDKFTDFVINIINKECDNVVFLLWGSHAQKKAKGINENKYLSYEKTGINFSLGISF